MRSIVKRYKYVIGMLGTLLLIIGSLELKSIPESTSMPQFYKEYVLGYEEEFESQFKDKIQSKWFKWEGVIDSIDLKKPYSVIVIEANGYKTRIEFGSRAFPEHHELKQGDKVVIKGEITGYEMIDDKIILLSNDAYPAKKKLD